MGAVSLTAALVTGMAACSGNAAPSSGSSSTGSPSTTASRPSTSVQLDGTAFYAEWGTSASQVWSVRNGTVTKHHRIPISPGDHCVANSVIVSPDGQWLAWVSADPDGDIRGRLSVSHLDGRNPRTLDDVVCAFNEFSWTPDSRALTVTQVDNDKARYLHIDPQTGATTAVPAPDGVVWSANRSFRVHKKEGKGTTFVVENAAGHVVHTVNDYSNDHDSFDTCGYSLKGLSNDGRFVSIGGCSTDPSRVMGSHHLYDTVAGRHVALPGPDVDSITFPADGVVLVHDHGGGSGLGRLVLMSAEGTVLASVAQPSALPKRATFLIYVPARQ